MKLAHIFFKQFSAQLNFHLGSWYCFLRSMSNIVMQSQPYPLSVTFNVFRQMAISPKVSLIRSQSKRLYIGLGNLEID